jgi:Predicted membrane protein
MSAHDELLGPQLARHVAKYNESHRNAVNRALHFAGIPLAAIATLGLLSRAAWPAFDVQPWLQPNLAMVVLAVAGGRYLWCNLLAGLILLATGTAGYVLATQLPPAWLLGMAVASVVCHYIGHYGFEGKPPQLLTRPVAVIEAPVWLMAMFVGLRPSSRA